MRYAVAFLLLGLLAWAAAQDVHQDTLSEKDIADMVRWENERKAQAARERRRAEQRRREAERKREEEERRRRSISGCKIVYNGCKDKARRFCKAWYHKGLL